MNLKFTKSSSQRKTLLGLVTLMNCFINTVLRKPWIYGVAAILLSYRQSAIAANWYVDNAVGASGNGQSWASAFKTFSAISWSAIQPGDTLYISGGQTLLTTQVPQSLHNSDGSGVNYELGMRFMATTFGTIKALRFYKDSSESGTHTGNIYSASGTRLTSVVFSGETASGWQ